MSRLDDFVKLAEGLGATIETFEPDVSVQHEDFRMAISAPQGGCGLRHCCCSPGLWVSAFEGNRGACAHFGEDWQRGGVGAFSVQDFHQWEKLVKMLGHSVPRLSINGKSSSRIPQHGISSLVAGNIQIAGSRYLTEVKE